MTKKVYKRKSNNYKAGILDQARLRPHITSQQPSVKGKTVNTLIKLKASRVSEKTS